jgi:hypothetical protein
MAKKKREGRAVERPDFETVNDYTDLAAQLELMEIYVVRGSSADILDEDVAQEVKYRLQESREELMRNQPDGELILQHITEAHDRVLDAHPQHEMVDTLAAAVEAAREML